MKSFNNFSFQSIATISILVLLLSAAIHVDALYKSVDIEKVPVNRLIQNLEKLVAKEPKNSQLRFNLARVHAMAFALKLPPKQKVEAVKGNGSDGAWFGYNPLDVPFVAVTSNNPAAMKAAREHLSQAIRIYKETLLLDPSNDIARLGLAWCLDQFGDKAQAIAGYRSIVAEGWAREQALREKQADLQKNERQSVDGVKRTFSAGLRDEALGDWGDRVPREAAVYLIPLLDGEKDRDEIQKLHDGIDRTYTSLRFVTPIAIPLHDGAGLSDLVNKNARVIFDADGSGIQRRWTWITPNAGWLVHAPHGSRPISSALQMFGNVTFWLFWENGYQALQALDDNGDAILNGRELEDLAIWQDSNSNGKAESGEVRPLAEWGIVSLSYEHKTMQDNLDCAAYSTYGVMLADGRTRPTYDVLLYSNESAPVLPAVTTLRIPLPGTATLAARK